MWKHAVAHQICSLSTAAVHWTLTVKCIESVECFLNWIMGTTGSYNGSFKDQQMVTGGHPCKTTVFIFDYTCEVCCLCTCHCFWHIMLDTENTINDPYTHSELQKWKHVTWLRLSVQFSTYSKGATVLKSMGKKERWWWFGWQTQCSCYGTGRINDFGVLLLTPTVQWLLHHMTYCSV